MLAQNNTILIVEDEPHISYFISTALIQEAYQVHKAMTLKQALQFFKKNQCDLLILDLGLPDGDGLALIQEIRLWSKLPILVLSARIQELDKIKALDAGADDYLTKPFSIGELLARMRALLRRSQFVTETPTLFQFGTIAIDLQQRKITRGQEVIHLTPIEFQLLSLFLLNAERVLTHRYLLTALWGNAYTENNHYLRIYVRHLRQKLELDPSQPQHFLTETGIGYRFQF